MSSNLVKKEKSFFEKLKKVYTKSDKVKLDYSQVPKGHRFNDLDRYFKDINSIWFIRSKIKDSEVYYYFGLKKNEQLGVNEGINPNLIIKFNEEEAKSNLRFVENKIYLMCNPIGDNESVEKKLKTFKKLIGKQGIYIYLGNLDENDIPSIIEKLLNTFKFEVTFNKSFNIIGLHDEVLKVNSEKNSSYNQSDISKIRLNLEIIKLKNFLEQNISSKDFLEEINNYLFLSDENNNFKLNESLFYKSLSIFDIINILKDTIANNFFSSINGFLVNFNDNREKYFSNISNPTDLNLYGPIVETIETPAAGDVDVSVDDVDVGVVSSDVDVSVDDVDAHDSSLNSDIWNVKEEVILNDKQSELFEDYLILKEDAWIDFEASNYNISEQDKNIIFLKIKEDISKNEITEEDDMEDIIISYFKQYSLDNNSSKMIQYFNKVINSSFFNQLLEKYSILKDEDVEDIKLKIKNDIQVENLDKDDVCKRFEFYFKNKHNEILYKKELQNINKNTYKIRYNLTISEITEVVNEAIEKIEKWHENLLIFEETSIVIFEKLLHEKLNSIRSEIRQKFEMHYNKNSVGLVLNIPDISDDIYEKLIDEIYKDIRHLKIRLEDVNDNLIIEYYELM